MIAYIKGTIQHKQEGFIVLENQGLGYKIFVPEEVLLKAKIGDALELYLYHYVREDQESLFGFAKKEELDLFEKLISVSGIGPKTGLGVFAISSVADIKSAIIHGDASILKKVSGIGAKTAERIVLELKNKIDGLIGVDGIKSSDELTAGSDVIDALVGLGFSAGQAREALSKVDPTLSTTEDQVKAALKILNTK
jgi:holliday junction DNA helicase RuvA